jgi:hypothetical protein
MSDMTTTSDWDSGVDAAGFDGSLGVLGAGDMPP